MNSVVPILALSFANAAVLGWLAAAAVPILIHLWMKRAHRETPWAAVRFLQAAIRRHARRLRLQEWLLLAIRTAIILLVVLAASKPLVDSLGGLIGPGVRTHRVLVLDASMSMRLEGDDETLGGSCFSRAQSFAQQLIDDSGPSDQFSVCIMSAKPTSPLSTPTVDRNSVARAIANVEPTDGVADIASTLRLASRILSNEGQGAAERREVVFFSDLTMATWRPLTGSGDETSQLFAELAEQAQVAVVDVGVAEATNLAVTDLRIVSGATTLQNSLRLLGRIENFGKRPDSTTVELLVDGLAVASRTIEFDGTSPAAVEFTHRFNRPGWRRVAVRLPTDSLATDDQRFVALEVKPHMPVLCVEGRRGAARYVASAMDPTDEGRSPIQPTVVSDSELPATRLDEFDAVFLCNVAELTEREAERLNRYVRGGGGLAMFLGDRVRPERYNAVLGAEYAEPEATGELSSAPRRASSPFRLIANSSTDPLLPVVLRGTKSQTNYGVDPLAYRHPIVAPFRGRERAGLLTTPIERYFQMRIAKRAEQAEVVLATTGGDPLLVASSVGSGRVVVIATAGSLASVDPATGRPWTAMPAWPSFVPIVREVVRYASGADAERPTTLVGQPVGQSAVSSLAGGQRTDSQVLRKLQLVRPDETAETVAINERGRGWSYERTDVAGFYSLNLSNEVADNATDSLFLAAVNPDPTESDTTRVAPDRLPAELSIRQVAWEGGQTTAEIAPRSGVHRWLLLAAIVLLLVESLLACRFGRGAA